MKNLNLFFLELKCVTLQIKNLRVSVDEKDFSFFVSPKFASK